MAGKKLTLTPQEFYREVVIPYGDADRCLIWPYARNKGGYAVMWNGYQMEYVHREVCVAENGAQPSWDKRYDAAHLCGNGKKGCVNPLHLSWKERADNEADKLRHGTHNRGERHGRSRLLTADIRKIRALKGKATQRVIAETYGISRSYVSEIHSGKKWHWLDSGKA